jgi:hypothetical protein
MKALSVILMAILLCSCAAGQRAAKIATGVAAAYGIHEAGHVVAARVTDTPINWDSMEYTITPKDNNGGAIVCAAGLTAQAASSEIIIRKNYRGDFAAGMMLWNVINPILYASDYWIDFGYPKDQYGGDIRSIEAYSNHTTSNLFSIAIAGLAAFDAYRYWLGNNKPVGAMIIPARNGAGLVYSRKF